MYNGKEIDIVQTRLLNIPTEIYQSLLYMVIRETYCSDYLEMMMNQSWFDLCIFFVDYYMSFYFKMFLVKLLLGFPRCRFWYSMLFWGMY